MIETATVSTEAPPPTFKAGETIDAPRPRAVNRLAGRSHSPKASRSSRPITC